MKSVSIFLELDSDEKPLYRDILIKKLSNDEIIYASEEYIKGLEDAQKEKVHCIPQHILNDIDKNLESKANRSVLLKITYQEQIEKWFQNEIDSIQECGEIVLFGNYESFLNVARKKHLPCLIYENSSVNQTVDDNEKYYQKIIQDMRNHIDFIEGQLSESKKAVEILRKDIESNGNYIHNLEEHATELDNEKEKYRVFYENNLERVENMDQQSKYYEKRISEYLEMYKKVVSELDEKKTEVLDLKKSLEKKK